MPVMLPPGQGVTVAIPTPVTAMNAPATPPEPFKKAVGPDVVLLPHQDSPQTPQQNPQQPG